MDSHSPSQELERAPTLPPPDVSRTAGAVAVGADTRLDTRPAAQPAASETARPAKPSDFTAPEKRGHRPPKDEKAVTPAAAVESAAQANDTKNSPTKPESAEAAHGHLPVPRDAAGEPARQSGGDRGRTPPPKPPTDISATAPVPDPEDHELMKRLGGIFKKVDKAEGGDVAAMKDGGREVFRAAREAKALTGEHENTAIRPKEDGRRPDDVIDANTYNDTINGAYTGTDGGAGQVNDAPYPSDESGLNLNDAYYAGPSEGDPAGTAIINAEIDHGEPVTGQTAAEQAEHMEKLEKPHAAPPAGSGADIQYLEAAAAAQHDEGRGEEPLGAAPEILFIDEDGGLFDTTVAGQDAATFRGPAAESRDADGQNDDAETDADDADDSWEIGSDATAATFTEDTDAAAEVQPEQQATTEPATATPELARDILPDSAEQAEIRENLAYYTGVYQNQLQEVRAATGREPTSKDRADMLQTILPTSELGTNMLAVMIEDRSPMLAGINDGDLRNLLRDSTAETLSSQRYRIASYPPSDSRRAVLTARYNLLAGVSTILSQP